MAETKEQQLELLRQAVGLLPAEEVAQRARDILDYDDEAVQELRDVLATDVPSVQAERVNLRAYLAGMGWEGRQRDRIHNLFLYAVVTAFVAQHDGDYPPADDQGYVYITDDLPLIDAVYEQQIERIQLEVFGAVYRRADS